MKLSTTLLALLLPVLFTAASCGESEGSDAKESGEGATAGEKGAAMIGPGGITLVDGYEHVRMEAAEGINGRLTKTSGTTILYRIGWATGNYTAQLIDERGLSGTEEELGGGRRFSMAQDQGITFMTMTKEKGDSALWPANFQAPVTDAATVEEMKEMVQSYDPE